MIIAEIIDLQEDETGKEVPVLIESKEFPNATSYLEKEVLDWNYEKIHHYNSIYNFAEYEDLNVNLHTYYYEVVNSKKKLIKSDDMVEDFFNL